MKQEGASLPAPKPGRLRRLDHRSIAARGVSLLCESLLLLIELGDLLPDVRGNVVVTCGELERALVRQHRDAVSCREPFQGGCL